MAAGQTKGRGIMKDSPQDIDPVESQEWQDAIEDVILRDGADRAHFLLDKAVQQARAAGAKLPFSATTPYQNTIAPDDEVDIPGDTEMEWRIRTINRWNAMATVVKRNKVSSEYGGHIASFASSAALYDIGLNHFWRSKSAIHGGDLVFFQGHVIPGIYARSFMEGRISAEQLEAFRSEVDGGGLSSYPHPWLMPDYWQFPTVSMGLGPLMAIYQARFMKYMHNRGLIDMGDRKVWCFLGDGEMDEPESRGAIDLAHREGLDNLIFVVNCNLQRLDGPVRGNGKTRLKTSSFGMARIARISCSTRPCNRRAPLVPSCRSRRPRRIRTPLHLTTKSTSPATSRWNGASGRSIGGTRWPPL
jgi:pyruvate dehydrogenase E1 component